MATGPALRSSLTTRWSPMMPSVTAFLIVADWQISSVFRASRLSEPKSRFFLRRGHSVAACFMSLAHKLFEVHGFLQ